MGVFVVIVSNHKDKERLNIRCSQSNAHGSRLIKKNGAVVGGRPVTMALRITTTIGSRDRDHGPPHMPCIICESRIRKVKSQSQCHDLMILVRGREVYSAYLSIVPQLPSLIVLACVPWPLFASCKSVHANHVGDQPATILPNTIRVTTTPSNIKTQPFPNTSHFPPPRNTSLIAQVTALASTSHWHTTADPRC